MNYGLGALYSSIDQRDYAITKFTTEQLDKNQPVPEVQAKFRQQHIDNQGKTSLCSAYTMCNKVTTRVLQRTGEYVLFSPAAFYGNREHMAYHGEGMMGRDTMQGARKSGFIRRDLFPIEKGTFYQCRDTFNMKSAFYKENSIVNKTEGFALLRDAYEVAQYIKQEEVPCWIAFDIYENIVNAEYTGIIEQPSGKHLGGHAVLAHDIVYIKGQPYFKFANSWGKSWGDKGWGYLPVNMMREAWGDYDRSPLEEEGYPTEFVIPLKDFSETMNTRTIWCNTKGVKLETEYGARVISHRIEVTDGKAVALVDKRTMIIVRPLWEAIGWHVEYTSDYVRIYKDKSESDFRRELGLN